MNLREWVKHEDDIIAHVFERIESWRAAGHPPAQTYFTAGLERQVAIMIERDIADERAACSEACVVVYRRHRRLMQDYTHESGALAKECIDAVVDRGDVRRRG